MDSKTLQTVMTDLVEKQGLENVIAALAEAAVTLAENQSALGHEQEAQETLVIAEALTGIYAEVEG